MSLLSAFRSRTSRAHDHGDLDRLRTAIAAFAGTASFEIAAKDAEGLNQARPYIPSGSTISVTWMPNDTHDHRVAAAKALCEAGYEPVPHIAARRILGVDDFDELVGRLTSEAGVSQLFIIAGDVPDAIGPFSSSLELLARCRPERLGIKRIGVGGHPEGHPIVSDAVLRAELDTKLAFISDIGAEPFVITQFAFSAEPIVDWLRAFRERGNEALVRIGLAGPAGVRTLLRFARHCGVGASTRVLMARGTSIAQLINEAGPDAVIEGLMTSAAAEDLGAVALHLFPFGGLERTARWIGPVSQGRFIMRKSEAGFHPEAWEIS
ncbi:MAG TPA: methylenetetrahydrofolate reductase [Allosphingosinicella sp.]|nr:methylenetetrahydrofolate reductase [Allosphingosinicella sp.]